MRRLAPLLLLFLSSALLAQSGVWGARGVSHAFLVRGDKVYDIDGRGIALYDVATFTRVAVANSDAESIDGAFAANGDLLVLTRAGIDRYDAQLARLSHADGPGFEHLRANERYVVTAGPNDVSVSDGTLLHFASHVNAIALNGDALYVALDQTGVAAVDLTGANGTTILPEKANDLAVSGNQLVIAGGVDGLLVADVSDPFAPRIVRREGAGESNVARVAVAGTKIFASESPSTIRVYDGSGLIATITDPVQALAAAGTRLFASGTNFDRFGLATETGAPLHVYDVAGTPRLIGEVRDLAGPVSGAATDGTFAYIVDRPFFRVLDVSTTSAPREVATLSIDAIEDHVKLLGKQVILYGRGDVDLIDVSDPYRPRLTGVFHSFGRPPSNAAFARDLIVEGNPWSGFHVVDFADFAAPAQIGGVKGHYYEIVGNGGDVAYISGEGVSLVAVDLRDPHNPTFTKTIQIGVKQAFIAGGDLVVRNVDGLHVYSLADPFLPAEAGFIAMSQPDVAGPAGGEAALVWSGGALLRVDLATRAIAPSGFTVLAPMQIDSAGGKTVVADRYALRVFGPNTPPPPPPPVPRRRAAHP